MKLPRALTRFGRRGYFLLLFGIAWSVVGASGLTYGASPGSTRILESLLRIAPFEIWSHLWLISGILAITASFFRQPGDDIFGFIALIVPVFLWTFSALMAFVAGLERGLLAAIVYAVLAVSIYIIAGWPEAPPRNGRRKREE